MTRLKKICDHMVECQEYLVLIALRRRAAIAQRDTVGVTHCDVLAAEERDRLAICGLRLAGYPAANDATTMPGAA